MARGEAEGKGGGGGGLAEEEHIFSLFLMCSTDRPICSRAGIKDEQVCICPKTAELQTMQQGTAYRTHVASILSWLVFTHMRSHLPSLVE